MKIFSPVVDSTLADVIAISAATIAIAAVIGVVTLRTPDRRYDPRTAWLRAIAYFGTALVVSRLANVLPTLIERRPAQTDRNGFALAIVVCGAIEVVAYGVIWPIGTLTHGRSRRVGWQLGFGVLWGLCEAQLFLSFWSVTERYVANVWATAGVAFVLISAFTGFWHDQYWDIHVAPDHNIAEWNARKVLFCHVPNLIATLSFLAIYTGPGWFVAFQTVSLTLSVWFMRFPPPIRRVATAGTR